MTNKKLELKRLLLFLLITFALSWIPAIILNKVVGYSEWFDGPWVILSLPLLYAPALANIITRKITKEGWHDSLMHLNFKGNFKYYLLTPVFPLMMSVLDSIFMTLVYGHWDFSEMLERQSIPELIVSALVIIGLGPLFTWNTFGEEFGWRAYMNQKMEPLLGTTGTVIVGGIIWGVWHAPLTVEGHNFGTEYWGYPWLGIVCMALHCTVMGVFLMWLTKKTNSIFPAAIMHACNNMGTGSIGTFFISGLGDITDFQPPVTWNIVCLIPSAIVAAVFVVMMRRERRAADSAQNAS